MHSARAMEVTEALDAAGFDVRVNEPWSGYDGFMYSADSLKISAGPGRRSAIMLELRNDEAKFLMESISADKKGGAAAGVDEAFLSPPKQLLMQGRCSTRLPTLVVVGELARLGLIHSIINSYK